MTKRLSSALLALLLVISILSGCGNKAESINLKQNGNAYELHTVEDLQIMAQHPDENYILMENIDMQGTSWPTGGTFSGSFNGNGKTISNLSITAANGENMGLFASVEAGGKIQNLSLENVTVSASETDAVNIGTFAGVNKGTITGCSVTGIISDNRMGTEENPIYAGAFVGKAESGSRTEGAQILQLTDNAGIYTTEELSADVRLFVADSETVFYGFAGLIAENARISGQWVDRFYSSERLSETIRQRQQIAVDYMYKMGTVAWTVPSTMTHKGSSEIHDQIFEPGQTYYGIPYDHTAGSYERFMSVMDENNQVLGEVATELGKSDWTTKEYGFTLYMGNDCSSAVGWAWMQISPNEVGKDINGQFQGGAYVLLTNDMIPNINNQENNGIYPVGSWNGTDFISRGATYQTMTLTKCSEIVEANGEEKIFEAYAQTRKADALIFGEPGGHARLVAEDPIVIRNADGSIDTQKSYFLLHEQGDGLYNNRYQHSNSSWRINYRYTFDVLMHGSNKLIKEEKYLEAGSGKGYLPITIRALQQEDMPEAFVAEYPESREDYALTPASGRIYSNYRIQSTTVTVKDASGNVVYDQTVFTGTDGVYESYRGANTTVHLATYHSAAMDGQSAGTYTFTVQATLSNGSTHTVVENQTYEHA